MLNYCEFLPTRILTAVTHTEITNLFLYCMFIFVKTHTCLRTALALKMFSLETPKI